MAPPPTVYYVAKRGDDSNAGTDPSSPKLTINNAVAAAYGAGTGNIVEIIDSGQYNEGDINIFTNPITVRATGSNKPIMDGDSGNNDYAFVPYISGNLFQGLHMRNYDDGLINTSFNSNAKSYILSGCIGHFIGGPQQIGNGLSSGQSAEVKDCLIVSDTRNAFTCENAIVWFNNSVVASNAVAYPAIDSQQANVNITASFCTFIGSGHDNNAGRYYNIVNRVYKVINCIVSGSGDGINAFDSTYNLVEVSGEPFITWSNDSFDGTPRTRNTGEQSGDPLFQSGSQPGTATPAVNGNVDFDTQWYTITEGSRAIDAGVSYLSVTTDISGNTRTSPDIGAYEYISQDPEWSSYTSQPQNKYGADFTINSYLNMSSNYKFKYSLPNRQAPFSLGQSGPPTVRERNTPYKVE